MKSSCCMNMDLVKVFRVKASRQSSHPFVDDFILDANYFHKIYNFRAEIDSFECICEGLAKKLKNFLGMFFFKV